MRPKEKKVIVVIKKDNSNQNLRILMWLIKTIWKLLEILKDVF